MRNSQVRQRGFAMIAMLTMFALVTTYLVVDGMQRTQAQVTVERDLRNLQSLKEAKAALIAYVATQAGTVTANTNPPDQPGALPCPAADDLGVTTSCTASASTRIGRFPWKTIGASDLRDASGQILWYAVSANFRPTSAANGTQVINSDTQGTLTVTGTTPATNVVAVIIAPGNALTGQDRTSTSISNYLESTNASNTDAFVTAQSSDTFNDRLTVITQDEVMAMVEPIVASRIEQYVKPYLNRYFYRDSSNRGWGAFPFPAAFSDATYTTGPGANGTTSTTRGQDYYVGDTSQTSGLLPITTSSANTTYSWTAGSGSVSLTGGTVGTLASSSCATYLTTYWRCDFVMNALNSVATCGASTRYCMVNPVFTVSGRMGTKAATSFADLPTASSVTVTNTGGGGTTRTVTGASIDGTTAATTFLGTVTYSATHSYSRYNASSFTRNMRVTIPIVVTSSWINNVTPDADTGWFIKNEWYRQTYYAVAPGYLPGGSSTCSAGSTCLTVNNMSATTYPTTNDKRAVLIFAGRALSGSHPTTSIANYLEGTNQSPANGIFTNVDGTKNSAATFNDRLIVVSSETDAK
jgi:hypothetical protein